MIGQLVEHGLPGELIDAMDVVRVFGNEAVHAGQILGDDDEKSVATLAEIINTLVEERIARPERLAAMTNLLPEEKRKAAMARNEKYRSP